MFQINFNAKIMAEKKKLLLSFSGGRTSGMMVWWCLNNLQDEYEMIVVFANTGKEAEGTLEFVEECSRRFGVEIYWVEAKFRDENGVMFSNKGWSVSHKVVDFDTASRNGEPFEELISCLGIPSTNAPFCSDQLKRKAIESFMKEIGWDDYYKAIGIRYDEVDRVNPNWKKLQIIYPFVSLVPTTKKMVDLWWNKQDFKLNIPVGLGNCDNCWKKSLPMLVKNAKRNPSTFYWWKKMEEKYGYYNPRNVELELPFHFFRGNLSVDDIFKLVKVDEQQLKLFSQDNWLDGCGESCEVF